MRWAVKYKQRCAQYPSSRGDGVSCVATLWLGSKDADGCAEAEKANRCLFRTSAEAHAARRLIAEARCWMFSDDAAALKVVRVWELGEAPLLGKLAES